MMARVVFTLVSLVCVFQASAAPHPARAVSNIACSEFGIQADSGIKAALDSLNSITGSSDSSLAAAQTALSGADAANTQIGDSILTLDAPPAPADASTRVVSGLQDAIAALGKVAKGTDSAALTKANSSMTTALAAAQKAVAANCQTTVFTAPAGSANANLYSMVSISEPPTTTTLRAKSSPSSAAPAQTTTTAGANGAAPESAAVLTGSSDKPNGAMATVPPVSLMGVALLLAIVSF